MCNPIFLRTCFSVSFNPFYESGRKLKLQRLPSIVGGGGEERENIWEYFVNHRGALDEIRFLYGSTPSRSRLTISWPNWEKKAFRLVLWACIGSFRSVIQIGLGVPYPYFGYVDIGYFGGNNMLMSRWFWRGYDDSFCTSKYNVEDIEFCMVVMKDWSIKICFELYEISRKWGIWN